MARGVSRGTKRGHARKKVWAREVGGATVAASTTTNFDLLTDFETQLGAQPFGVTVIRIRGQLLLSPGTAPVAQSGLVNLGIRVWNESADLQGAADANAEHADWMGWSYVPLHFAADSVPEVSHAYRWEVDISSMRRMDELGQSLMLSVANNIAGMAIVVQYGFSTLLMMP